MASKNGSVIGKVLPYLAIGGLLYLMAKNSGKLALPAPTGAAAAAPVGSPTNNAGCVDFGTAGCGNCWCG